jgi:hypothetical protein
VGGEGHFARIQLAYEKFRLECGALIDRMSMKSICEVIWPRDWGVRAGIGLVCMIGWLGVATEAVGQVTVSVTVDQDQVLIGENVRVAVRITNFSGQSLRLGEGDHWLRFLLETPQGHLVPRRGSVPVDGAFLLDSSKVATKRVDLGPYFDLSKPSRYRITAGVWIEEWGQEIVSQPASVEVVRGTTMWEQLFGVPVMAGSSHPPEARRYALQQAMHMKKMTLYARVTDSTGQIVYRVLPLGLLLSFSDPEKQIDRESNLHVLWQTGARSFNYSVLNPDGERIIRQTHDYSESRPVLRRDREGRIFVGGGIRRLAVDDIPTPQWRPIADEVVPEQTPRLE